ncbi:MAG: 4Fe-4S binding protein [Slackia sp.]
MMRECPKRAPLRCLMRTPRVFISSSIAPRLSMRNWQPGNRLLSQGFRELRMASALWWRFAVVLRKWARGSFCRCLRKTKRSSSSIKTKNRVRILRYFGCIRARGSERSVTPGQSPALLRFGDERMNAGIKALVFHHRRLRRLQGVRFGNVRRCIDVSMVPAVIDQQRCTRCGNCEMACFQEAIVILK